jgi:hypothetical protein
MQAGQAADAVKVAFEELSQRPGLVLALRTAELLKASGDTAGALRAIDSVLPLRVVPFSLVPVAAQAAQFCAESGAPKKAVEIYRTLLAIENLSLEWRLALLPPAMKAAEAAGDAEVLGLWKQMLEMHRPKPVQTPKP